MGNCCCKKRSSSHSDSKSNSKQDISEEIVDDVKEDNEEKYLLQSASSSTAQKTPPQTKELETPQTCDDPISSSPEQKKIEEEDVHPLENGITDEEEEEEEDKIEEKLILSHPVPMTGDRLLINELKTKFPDGLEDLKRRTRESLQNSFRRSQQRVILLPPPTQVYDTNRHPSDELIDNLKILEEKLRNTQKMIINNTELSMTNILEQFKLDLANIETSLHPPVIDKRKEVYCKLKACFYLSSNRERPTTLESYENTEDTKKTGDMLQLEKCNQVLDKLQSTIEENNGILQTQKEIEDILVSLENVKASQQEELIFKNYLREKALYLIKECILKNMR